MRSPLEPLISTFVAVALLATVVGGLSASAAPGRPHHTVPPGPDTVPPDREVPADGETEPVGAAGDAADDLAFWVHPHDPALSVVIGTDKEGALETYDLAGQRLQSIDPGSRPGNVDLRGGFSLSGQVVDLIGVVGYGMRLYTIDPVTRSLTNVTAPTVKPGMPVAGMPGWSMPSSSGARSRSAVKRKAASSTTSVRSSMSPRNMSASGPTVPSRMFP